MPLSSHASYCTKAAFALAAAAAASLWNDPTSATYAVASASRQLEGDMS